MDSTREAEKQENKSCIDQSYICLNAPTAKHAYYLGVAGVILEGSFTFLGIFGYFVSRSKKESRLQQIHNLNN